MLRDTSVAILAVLFAFAGGSTAQSTRKHVDEEHGFEIRVPKWLEAIPVKAGDEQTLARFKGKKKSTVSGYKGEYELTLLVVRIERREGPTSGEGEQNDDGGSRSFAEQSQAYLNGGRNLDEFLKRRDYKHQLVPNDELFRKPIEDSAGRPYAVYQMSSMLGRKAGALIRAFVTEDANEIFGIVVLGLGLNPFHKEIVRALKSLERTQVAEASHAAEDPYAGSALRDLDRRRAVRAALVPGWRALDTENFIVVTNVDSNRVIGNMLIDLEVMRGAYLERFPPVEGADMSVVSTVRVCDGYDDYLRYAGAQLRGTGGYFNFVDEELVLFNPQKRVPKALDWLKKVDPAAVLYHEAMHQYFHYSNAQLSPGTWFNEGYGEVFGGAQVDRRKQEIKRIGPNDFRMDVIRLDQKRGGFPDLRSILRRSKGEFYASAGVSYAYAWAFCYFLEKEREKPERTRNQTWAELPTRYLGELRRVAAEYRKKLPDDAPKDWITGFQGRIEREAIDATLEGIDMSELDAAFEKFVKRLR